MKLVFEGIVTSGSTSRTSGGCYHRPRHEQDDPACDEKDGALWIGKRDVVSEVGAVQWNGPVTCAIYCGVLTGDTAFQGALKIAEGYGYSEYTPIDDDKLFVGPHDLLKIIGDLEGQAVTVWFADEPINVLEGVKISVPREDDPEASKPDDERITREACE